MSRQDRKYVVILALALALAAAVEVFKPAEIDWTESYERNDDRPFGSLILYDLLPDLFPDAEVRAATLPPYLVLGDTTRTGVTYVFITTSFAPDPFETEALLDFAARGNTVFVAAYFFSGLFADTLRLDTDYFLDAPDLSLDAETDSVTVNFVSPALRTPEDFVYKDGTVDDYFDRFDTLRTTVLGVNSRGEANYVRVARGDGAFYLSTLPLAFTNYYLLYRNNADYVYRALSYLPAQDVLWDAFYKPDRNQAATPLRFILQDEALRWAYWVVVALVVLFIVFEARRRQRIIPIIAPLRNTTVEFVRTVGHLYFHHGDHANLAEKKITYLLDYVRSRLRLPTSRLDDDFLDRVAERSGVPPDEVGEVFAFVRRIRGRPRLPESELIRLNTLVESFYRKSKR